MVEYQGDRGRVLGLEESRIAHGEGLNLWDVCLEVYLAMKNILINLDTYLQISVL